MFLSNLGKIGDRNSQNTKIFLKCGCWWWGWWCMLCLLFGVSTWAGGQALWGFRTCRRLALVLWSCVLSFCPLSRFVFGALYLNMPLFRVFRGFLAGFRAFRVGLCGLRALRGLWGFCVREWLGGLEACGVFASLFVLLPFFFCSCVCLLLCWLSFFALVVFLCSLALSCLFLWSLWSLLLFPFPFRTIRKKKGRAVLVRPLFVCRKCSNSCNVIEELRYCCFHILGLLWVALFR